MAKFRWAFLGLLLLPTPQPSDCVGNDYPHTYTTIFDEYDGVRVLLDQESAIAAASRDEMCTIILFGAPWDGHFKMFASTYRHWHELAILLDKVQDVELAYYEYTGQSNGSRSIPSELHLNPTLGSYEWHGYQSGKRLWHNGRECWSSGWDVNCIMKLCLSEIVLNPDNLDL